MADEEGCAGGNHDPADRLGGTGSGPGLSNRKGPSVGATKGKPANPPKGSSRRLPRVLGA